MAVEKFSRYEIRAELGIGGMATVYRAYDPMFEREVALKILKKELLEDPQVRERFERETKIIARLEHAVIVPVYDVGFDNGQLFYVMRYMGGGSLSERIIDGVTPNEIAHILIRMSSALDYAHVRGVVHRDLKPGNILFDENNNPYISDFGIAKLTQAATRITQSGIIGTPRYMSPEQARGDDADGRSDLYSLGVILFEMLSGHTPFEASTPLAMAFKHAVEAPPSILETNPNLPPGIDAVISKALAKQPEDRYKTCTEFTKAFLEAFPEASSPDANLITPLPPRYHNKHESPTELPISEPRSIIRWMFWIVSGILTLILFALIIRGYPGFMKIFTDFNIDPYNAYITRILPAIGKGITIFLSLVAVNYALGFTYDYFKNHRISKIPARSRNLVDHHQSSMMMTSITLGKIDDPQTRQAVLELIGRDHAFRLKKQLLQISGGRYLLHGYGRFGATALIDQILDLAKNDIASQSQTDDGGGIVMAVRIDASTIQEAGDGIDAVVQEFRFGVERGDYPKAFRDKLKKLNHTSSGDHSVEVKFNPMPGMSIEFAKKTNPNLASEKKGTSHNELMETIVSFLDRTENHKSPTFESFAYKFAYSKEIPTRLIIIIEKIESETVFAILRQMKLFKDERISFFALVDQEQLILSQENEKVLRMIKELDFEMHYMPCFWEEETKFIQKILGLTYGLFEFSGRVRDFKDHVAYISRGSPLDALDEALNFEYRNPDDGKLNLNLSTILDWDKLEGNAKIQRILCVNWEKILIPYFNGSGNVEKDRVKRSIYKIVDWMNEERIFTITEVLNFVDDASVKISKKPQILKSVIEALISVLVEEKFLRSKGEKYGVAHRVKDEDLQ